MDLRRTLNPVVTLLAVGIVAAACSSTSPTARDSRLQAGDTLHGRMVRGREAQTFTFEGVESSLLDFTLQADDGSEASPVADLFDPEGRPLDVGGATTTSAGSATTEVRGLVLPKTGTYQVRTRPAIAGRTVFYRFTYEIRYAPMPDTRTFLSSRAARPVYVAAPRGGLIAFSIKPASGSSLVPDVMGVKDPWGGPALDKGQVPRGAQPPRVSHSHDGAMILTFTASRPGMYTILAAAKPGRNGVGTLSVDVRPPDGPNRVVLHDGRPAEGFGVPGQKGQPAPNAPAVPAPSAKAGPAVPPPPPDPEIAQR